MVTFMVMKADGERQITAAEFKAKCLDLMDQVQQTGSSIVITKRGRPVARLAPVRASAKPLRGLLKGRIKELGDIIAPIDVEWDANR